MTLLQSATRNLYFATLLLALIGSPASAQFDDGSLSEFVENGMEMWNVPGMAVAVVSSDQVLFEQGFGETAIQDGQKVDEHTLFAIASTTKAMVVAGILMLVEEKKLSLDDPITRHLPELHFNDPMLTNQIMVRDLLAHRTGLPSTDFWTFFQGMPLDEQIRRLGSIPAAAPLRTRLIYQNTMFELAGLLIERLSGKHWDAFLRERLWLPIGMTETYGAMGQAGQSKVSVKPYFDRDGELVQAVWDFPADLADAAGSVWSSIHDMSLWAQFLLRDGVTAKGTRLISESGFAEMFEPHQLSSPEDFYPTVELTQPNWRSYGLGWFQQDFQGRKIDFHTGSLSGLIAIIGLDRGGNRAVVVLGNRDHAEMRHAILWKVMDNNPPDEQRDWNQEIFDLYANLATEQDAARQESAAQRLPDTRPSLPLDHYTGIYESPGFGQVTRESADNGLVLNTQKVSFPMSHWQLDSYLVEYAPWNLREFAEFRIAPNGSILSFDLFGETFRPVQPDE
jgi:CubicO group peptidase (beta-lactamase class C family)